MNPSTHGSTQQQVGRNGRMRVTARNLLVAVLGSARKVFGEAGTKLFGISDPLNAQRRFRGEAVIEGGNVAAFLKERTDRFGVDGLKVVAPVSGSLSEAIVDLAKQIVAKIGTTADLNTDQLTRIATEYVTQACCIPLSAVEPFNAYLVRAKQYRTSMKALNRAQTATSPEAFEKGSDQTTIERLLDQARQAWASATRYLAESPHLAALRTQIDAPILFTSMAAWQKVAAIVDKETRLAVIGQLRNAMELCSNPYVGTTEVEQAIERVEGSQLLTVGNPHGVSIEAAIEAMASSRMPGVKPNGGTSVGFEGTPASVLGAAISGLNAHVRGTATRKDGRTIGYAFDVTEGESPTAPFTAPIAVAPRMGAAY